MRRLAWLVAAACLVGRPAAAADLLIRPAAWANEAPFRPRTIVEQTFSITNRGSKPVTVLNVIAPRNFTCALPKKVIPPGRAVELQVHLNVPPLAVGRNDALIRETIQLLIDGEVNPVDIPVQLTIIPLTPPEMRQLAPQQLTGTYQPRPGDRPTTLHVFYDSGCSLCMRFFMEYLEPLQKHFQGSSLTIQVADTNLTKGRESFSRLLEFKQRYGIAGSPGKVYAFVGQFYFVGASEIEVKLKDLLLKEMAAPTEAPAEATAAEEVFGPAREAPPPPPKSGPTPAESAALEREFLTLSAPGALAVGLIDGINPCAIATAVFLIVLLTRLGHDRRTLVLAGLAYTGAVYLTYLLLGLGLLKSLASAQNSVVTARLLNVGIAAVTLVFAVLQVRDVLRLRAGAGTREMTMQTPLRVKQWTHKFMREGLARPTVAVGAAVAGLLVTLLEAVCTGQVYLPVLQAMAPEAEYRGRVVQLLALYCGGFVLPLLAVLVLAFRGVSSDALAAAARRHLVPAKLALAALLLALAGWLLANARP